MTSRTLIRLDEMRDAMVSAQANAKAGLDRAQAVADALANLTLSITELAYSMTGVKVCFIVSPYRNESRRIVRRNVRYARAAMVDSFSRGEVPFAGHLLFTQIFEEDDPIQRARGISANHAIMRGCSVVAVYRDLGYSEGMCEDIGKAKDFGIPVQVRSIDWSKK